uniref:Uncharacterized protein n=1 Tax=Oryzias melastigma TaxID=30732 RepID=A0A3B3C2A5_ORYME
MLSFNLFLTSFTKTETKRDLNNNLEFKSISSSGFEPLTTPSMSVMSGGATMDWTMNLCLLFSLGS